MVGSDADRSPRYPFQGMYAFITLQLNDAYSSAVILRDHLPAVGDTLCICGVDWRVEDAAYCESRRTGRVACQPA
jgi:hypothetical protein